MKIISPLLLLLLGLQSFAYADSGNIRFLSGLWKYEEISHGGDAALPNKGLFLFYNGRFFQQTIDDDMGQAHTGSYKIAGDIVSFDVEMGVLVRENSEPPLAVRQNAENQAKISFKGDVHILGFEESTVQTLAKLADAETVKVYPLIGGYLVFTGNNFIYMSLEDDNFATGSGKYLKTGNGFSLHANPWISVSARRVTYSHNEDINLNLEQKVFSFSDGRKFALKMALRKAEQ